MNKLSFTVLIPAIHSIDDISRCLKSLNNIEYPEDLFQVAVLDCGVVPGLSNYLSSCLPKQSYRVRMLYISERPLTGPEWAHEQRVNEAINKAMKIIPADAYVITEDDCELMPEWLKKYEAALTEGVGALGGPDILPDGLGWFPRALDYILNSFVGTAGMRGKGDYKSDHYYPRKQNMLVLAKAIGIAGGFPEVIEDGKTGYIVEPEDEKALAGAVTSYYNKNIENEFVNNIKKGKEKFSWDRIVEVIEQFK